MTPADLQTALANYTDAILAGLPVLLLAAVVGVGLLLVARWALGR